MNNLFLEQVHNCIKDFINLYSQDKYISKREIDSFFDKYKDIIELSNKFQNTDNTEYQKFLIIINHGYELIDRKNKDYIAKSLISEKDYFDNMFKDIDPNIKLDDEQRKAILIDEDYSLIVAGAGSGKTTTMAAKVKYLIERKDVNPNNIILLSFTNSSVNDLSDLLNNKFKLNVEVLTFHKLGMKFLRGTENKKYEIIDDGGIFKVLSDYFLEVVFKDKKLLAEYKEAFSKYLVLDDNCLNFVTYDDYYKDYMNKKYEECKDDIKEELKKRVNSRSIYLKTINGEKVKSTGELKIANYLYLNSIPYQYEKLYPYILPDNRTYKPDFTIDDFDIPIFIEYYGLATSKTDGTYDAETEKYHNEIIKKRNTHTTNHTDLIEIFGNYESKTYPINILSEELSKRNIVRTQKSDKEIFYRLLETSKTHKYTKLIKLFLVFISIFKEKGYHLNDFEELMNNCEDNLVVKQLKYIKDAYLYYENKIHNQNKIDFQDMINYAYQNIEIFKEKRKSINYDYVIIDEYQDVSLQRHNFTKKISDLFQSKIVAVGDDWQTIYSFSGSDIDLFLKFEENMGYCEEIKITNTYRNSQELIDVAGDFILKNTSQIEKRLHSIKHLDKPINIVEYDYDESDLESINLSAALEALLIKIYKEHPQDNILLLSRFNNELDKLLLSKRFYKNKITDNKIICRKIPDAQIDFLTVHKSKGLGYDRVIILNGINDIRGFPSQIKDEPIIKYLKDNSEENDIDMIEYPEERRLFYVAMTRTKNELYIMTPTSYEKRSKFINEIENNQNVKVLDEQEKR